MPETNIANNGPGKTECATTNRAWRCNFLKMFVTLGIGFLLLGNPGVVLADHDEIENFGRRDLGANSMPLLTILLDFNSGNFSPGHDADFYRRLLFQGGAPAPSLAGNNSFFAEQSSDELVLGTFVFENAGVLGPFFHPDDPLTPGDETDFACARGMDNMQNPTPPMGTPGRTLPVAPCGFWQWNPGTMPPQWDNRSLEETLTNAIIAADLAGFPFSDYDDNGDNIIDNNELAILVVYAPSAPFNTGGSNDDFSTGAVVRRPTLSPFVQGRSGLRVHMDVATIGENGSAGSIVHELAHLLQIRIGGSYEGYGSSGRCVNNLFTAMSCTIVADADNRDVYHFDPYTKMRFGFLEPEITHLDDAQCVALQPIEDQPGSKTRSLILYDPDRGAGEYFMLEYRRPMTANYDGDPFGTGSFGLPDRGLGIWYVQTQANGAPASVSAFDGSGIMDAALYLVPPGRATNPMQWGYPVSTNGLWGPADGPAMLTWPDGTSTGVEVQVVQQQINELLLQVAEPGGLPCLNVPEPPLTEFVPVDEGVEIWDNGSLSVTRRIGTPIPVGKLFTVEYELEADEDTDGPVFVADDFPADFSPAPGEEPVLFFPPLVQGQPVTLSYTMQAGEKGGGYDLLTKLTFAKFTDNPEDPGVPEAYEIRSFISVWNPNANMEAAGDNEEVDGDNDYVPDSSDECPAEKAIGFDSDQDGCIDAIADIDSILDELSVQYLVDKNILHSLKVKTENAGKAADTGNYLAAIGALVAFVNEVKALEVKTIPEYEAYLMRSYAGTIQDYFAFMNNSQQ